MTILVTGATGFIGSHLVKHLQKGNDKVVSLIHDTPIWTKWLRSSVEPTIKVQGDIRNLRFLKRVFNQYDVSEVYHLAAQSIVKRAWKDPVNTFDINVMGTVAVLEVCRQLDVERVLVQSTDKVYGNTMNATEHNALQATEPYGSSKVCADVVAQTYLETYNMNIAITRCCNTYGYDWNNRIIPNTIRACLRGQSPVIYKNDSTKRQYIYISDVMAVFTKVIEGRGPINISVPEVRTQEEVVWEILRHFPEVKPTVVEKSDLFEIQEQSMRAHPAVIKELPEWGYTTFIEGIELTINAFKEYGI